MLRLHHRRSRAVRILGIGEHNGPRPCTGVIEYEFHPAGSRDFQPLSTYPVHRSRPASGPSRSIRSINVAYGFKKLDGRLAVYTVALRSPGMPEQLRLRQPAGRCAPSHHPRPSSPRGWRQLLSPSTVTPCTSLPTSAGADRVPATRRCTSRCTSSTPARMRAACWCRPAPMSIRACFYLFDRKIASAADLLCRALPARGREARHRAPGHLRGRRWHADPRLPHAASRGAEPAGPAGHRHAARRPQRRATCGVRLAGAVLRQPRLRRASAQLPRLVAVTGTAGSSTTASTTGK